MDNYDSLKNHKIKMHIFCVLYKKSIQATGPNGNYIYFPHAGSTSVIDNIYCWTSDLRTFSNYTAVAYSIDAFGEKGYETYEKRCAGLSIRAVCP